MTHSTTHTLARELAALIGSRICHDLISPIGAISNGVELMEMSGDMSGAPAGPELGLISESVDNANARVRFFRIAFGMASPGQSTGAQELLSILKGLETPRLRYNWAVTQDMPREEVKLACLLILCLETAMPRGGEISIEHENGHWTLCARSARLEPAPDLWARLNAVTSAQDLKSSDIQFLLAPLQAESLGRQITSKAEDDLLELIA